MSTIDGVEVAGVRSSHRATFLAARVIVPAVLSRPTSDALATAPTMTTTVFEVGAFAAPECDAVVVAVLPASAEVESTGRLLPGFSLC